MYDAPDRAQLYKYTTEDLISLGRQSLNLNMELSLFLLTKMMLVFKAGSVLFIKSENSLISFMDWLPK